MQSAMNRLIGFDEDVMSKDLFVCSSGVMMCSKTREADANTS